MTTLAPLKHDWDLECASLPFWHAEKGVKPVWDVRKF